MEMVKQMGKMEGMGDMMKMLGGMGGKKWNINIYYTNNIIFI